MKDEEIKKRADMLIGELTPTMSPAQRARRYQRARTAALGLPNLNKPYHAAHTVPDNPVLREIDRRAKEDLRSESGLADDAAVRP